MLQQILHTSSLRKVKLQTAAQKLFEVRAELVCTQKGFKRKHAARVLLLAFENLVDDTASRFIIGIKGFLVKKLKTSSSSDKQKVAYIKNVLRLELIFIRIGLWVLLFEVSRRVDVS